MIHTVIRVPGIHYCTGCVFMFYYIVYTVMLHLERYVPHTYVITHSMQGYMYTLHDSYCTHIPGYAPV